MTPSHVAPPAPAERAPPVAIAAQVLSADPHLAFHRAARAVRTSVALWRQLEREKEIDAAEAAQARLDNRRDGTAARRARVEAVVETVAHDHFEAALPGDNNDYDAMEAWTVVCGEARERLDAELYGDLATQPLSEVVARICRDVGLAPDWHGLAKEPWARAEIAAGEDGEIPVGAPLTPFAEGWAGRLRSEGLELNRPPPRPPRAQSVRWRRRHEPPGERPPPPLRVEFV